MAMCNQQARTLAIVALVILSGCTPLPHSPTETYILITTGNTKVAYWQTALAGLNRAGAEMKVKTEIHGPDSFDPNAERDEFRRAIARKPSGIMISAGDPNLLTQDIDSALQQGIPVITIDADAPNSKRLFFIGSDNYNGGARGGELVVKLLGGRGNVAIFTTSIQGNLTERLSGYQSAFDRHPGIKVIRTVDIKGDPTIAFDSAKELLNSKTKIDAMVCLQSSACPEVGEVVNRANMGGKIAIVAADTDPRTLQWIQKGVISATVAQKPFTMAYLGTKLLDSLHHNPLKSLTENYRGDSFSPLPTFIDAGTVVIDKDNVNALMQEAQAHNPEQ